MSEKPNETP